MEHLFKVILSCIGLFLLTNCNDSTSKEAIGEEIKTTAKKTQALILTQSFDFDIEQKDKVTGAYISHNQLDVPQNLAPQNKWFMFEGPVLENDVIAYRFYGDSRHRSDIYGKSIPDLVMDTVGWDYHEIKHWGTDVLKVGESLGIGSPAIWYEDSLYTFSNYEKKVVEIIKNDDMQSGIRFRFTDLHIGEHTLDVVHDWLIEAGQAYTTNSIKITKGKLPEGAFFATGIVKHIDQIETGVTDGVFYGYTWGKQSFHEEFLGLGIFASNQYQPTPIPNALSHTFIFKNAPEQVEYAFMAAWERGNSGVKTQTDFKKLLADVLPGKFLQIEDPARSVPNTY